MFCDAFPPEQSRAPPDYASVLHAASTLSPCCLLHGVTWPSLHLTSDESHYLHPLAGRAGARIEKVLVTGAGGRTGKLVFEQLKADDNYKPVGLARSSKAQKALKAVGASDDEVCVADVADESALAAAMSGCDAVVLCTSAVPAIKPLSLMKTMATKVLPFVKTSRPAFKFPKNGTPEEVDWLGAKKQIDAAKAAGIKQFVFVSSMGGTNPDNFLNSIGAQKRRKRRRHPALEAEGRTVPRRERRPVHDHPSRWTC